MPTITVKTKQCMVCGKTGEVQVDEAQFEHYLQGAAAQVAFPDLTASEREMIMTGIHGPCWETMNDDLLVRYEMGQDYPEEME